MTEQKKKPEQPESPLARAMRTGTLGGAKPPAEPAITTTPEKIEPEKDNKIIEKDPAPTKNRKRITGYVAQDIYQWTKIRAATEDRELSEILEDALRLYKAKVQP
jgi:hypothetical protein